MPANLKGLPIKIKDPRYYRGSLTVGYLQLSPKGRVFYKPVKRIKHFMRVVDGYGIQKAVFDEYLRGRKGRVIVHEKDTGKYLVASIKTWTLHSSNQNFGDGKQIFLSERFMHNSEKFDREVLESRQGYRQAEGGDYKEAVG